MKLTKTAVLAAALAVSCAAITLPAAPANAITLMDILRGGKKKEPVREPLPGVDGGVSLPNATVKQEAKPLPRVTGPRYYTYKADALKRVAVDKLADPVVTPGYTEGVRGTPSEIKFKMIADNAQGDAEEAVRSAILSKPAASGRESGLSEEKNALGTTPRRYTDLLGSLCDLVSGSGDRGTPVVHISGYFDSYIDG